MKDYGKMLKEYREKHGLSQAKIGKMVGISQAFISLIETKGAEKVIPEMRERLDKFFEEEEKSAIVEAKEEKKERKSFEETVSEFVKNIEKVGKEMRDTGEKVKHPKHYQLEIKGVKFEVRDIIHELAKDLRGDIGYELGNVIKYVCRAEKKNGIEDYRKALNSLEKVIELKEKGE